MSTGYGPAWRRYSRWRRLFWAALAGVLVSVLAMATLAPVFMGTRAELLPLLPLVSCWLVAFVSAMQVILFHCPKCDEYFSMRGLMFRPFRAMCVHCGLRKWAMDDYAVGLQSPPEP